jgi:hypothetical protein
LNISTDAGGEEASAAGLKSPEPTPAVLDVTNIGFVGSVFSPKSFDDVFGASVAGPNRFIDPADGFASPNSGELAGFGPDDPNKSDFTDSAPPNGFFPTYGLGVSWIFAKILSLGAPYGDD